MAQDNNKNNNRIGLDNYSFDKDCNHTLELIKSLNRDDFIKQYKYIQSLESDLKKALEALKSKATADFQDFLQAKTAIKFRCKDWKKVPLEFLMLDGAALNSVYKSIGGGKSFLKKYGLSVKETPIISWKRNLGGKE